MEKNQETLQKEFNDWFESLSEQEQKEHFEDIIADGIISEMKDNPIEY